MANAHGNSNSLYKNQLSGNNWFSATLQGQESNHAAIGSKVTLSAKIGEHSLWQTRTVSSQTGHRSQNSMAVHFGIADTQQIDTLKVEWPSGQITRKHNLNVNQHITITEEQSGNFTLDVAKVAGIAGDTATVPVKVRHNSDYRLSSFEINLSGITDSFQNAWIDTTNTLLAGKRWELAFNPEQEPVHIAAAGGTAITKRGTLFTLKVLVPDTAHSFLPVTIKKALFNTDLHPEKLSHGGVAFPSVGDVDFNGRIQAYDGSVILQHLIGNNSLSTSQRHIADVTQNGEVTAMDASTILGYVVDIYDALPLDTSTTATPQVDGITMSNQSYSSDKTVKIPVRIRNAHDIQSFEGKFTFTTSYLTFQNLRLGAKWDSYTLKVSHRQNEVRFAGASTDTARISNATFLIAEFMVSSSIKSSASPEVMLDEIRFNEGTTKHDITKSILVSIDEAPEKSIPEKLILHPNQPNPFNPKTTISFRLPTSDHVILEVFNSVGQHIRTLMNKNIKAGRHTVQFHGGGLSSGVYIYRLKTSRSVQSRKMLLMK